MVNLDTLMYMPKACFFIRATDGFFSLLGSTFSWLDFKNILEEKLPKICVTVTISKKKDLENFWANV